MKKSGRVTIAEVARRAGVSRAAVSYALRDDPNIAAATRARIRATAEALGYRPDPVLAKLMAHLHAGRGRRYAGKLALLNVHAEDRNYWGKVDALGGFRRSAEKRAGELGYEAELFWLHEPGRSPRRLAEMLLARGIRGLVVGSTGRAGSVVEFPWGKFAAVTVGYTVVSPALSRVVTHHYRNTRLALRRAAEAGYSKIGFIGEPSSEAMMEDLHLAAFLAHQRGVARAERVPPLFWDGKKVDALRRWFAAHRPEAILSNAPGVRELAAAGLRVPQDVALVKLLLWDASEGVAGVLPGYDRLGAAAVDLLVAQMQHDEYGVPADPKIVQADGRWFDGDSLPARSAHASDDKKSDDCGGIGMKRIR